MSRWSRATATLLLLASLGLIIWGDDWGSLPLVRPEAASPIRTPVSGTEDQPVRPPSGADSGAPSRARQATKGPEPTGQPVEIRLPAVGYRSDVGPMTVEPQMTINPPDFQRTFWVSDRGVGPTVRARDTTYFACHTNSRKSISEVPCNRLPGNVQVGDDVIVRLKSGSLTYDITSARKVRRDEFAQNQEIWGIHPGRLVWVTCYIENGRRTEFNYVVIAELAS